MSRVSCKTYMDTKYSDFACLGRHLQMKSQVYGKYKASERISLFGSVYHKEAIMKYEKYVLFEFDSAHIRKSRLSRSVSTEDVTRRMGVMQKTMQNSAHGDNLKRVCRDYC